MFVNCGSHDNSNKQMEIRIDFEEDFISQMAVLVFTVVFFRIDREGSRKCSEGVEVDSYGLCH